MRSTQKKKIKYKHETTKQKINPFPIKLFSPGAAVGNASSGALGGTVGWGTAQKKYRDNYTFES